ncbi:hypothetical protein [Serratia sp. D1N4]
MSGYERISFVVPFNDEGELIKPQTKFTIDTFPKDITLRVCVGFVGLRPVHKYSIELLISPIHLKMKLGDSLELADSFTETAIMEINTKGSILTGNVDGQVDVVLRNINIPGKGIYQILCHLTESSGSAGVLHTNIAFFTTE